MSKSRIYCNSCKNSTWHEIEVTYSVDREDDLFGCPQKYEAEILRCCGCDQITFKLIRHPFEFQDKKDEPEEELFPERGYKQRERRYFFRLPKDVHSLYTETLSAHDMGLGLLSTVGLRALIEAIVVDKVDKQYYKNNLESKIDALANTFQPDTIKTLQEFRSMGNKAIHAKIAPDKLDIHRALYVVEGIMEYYYGIDEHVDTFQRLKEAEDEQP